MTNFNRKIERCRNARRHHRHPAPRTSFPERRTCLTFAEYMFLRRLFLRAFLRRHLRYNNSRVVTGPTIPKKGVSEYKIKINKSSNGRGGCVQIGVAPEDIPRYGQDLHYELGWYINTAALLKYSGPPHNCKGSEGEEYGPRKGHGEYVRDGDTVGIVMDMDKGELSFVLNGENLGVAFSGIPCDKPLVPCAILTDNVCSVEFVF